MSPLIRNIIAVIVGAMVSAAINIGIIMVGPAIIPFPEGVDPMDKESLKANIHLLNTNHFITPFLAHALGTMIGAFVAALIAVTHKMRVAFIIGAFFLAGGIYSVFMLPAPTWFVLIDLIAAYLPMAWIGGLLANRNSN